MQHYTLVIITLLYILLWLQSEGYLNGVNLQLDAESNKGNNNTYLIPSKQFLLLRRCIHSNQLVNNEADAVCVGDTNPMIRLPEHTPKAFLILIV